MPLTFAHPAAILPFAFIKKRWWSYTGLIIGSVIPDFEGFATLGGEKVYSHTWWGMLWLDLPLGLAVAFLFHWLIRVAAINNMPGFLYRRFRPFKKLDWNSYFIKNAFRVVISMLIGITTHLLWDRFTHTDSYGYAAKAGIVLPPDENVELRNTLQYVSSVVGMIVMAFWIWRLPARSTVTGRQVWWPFWIIVLGTGALFWWFTPRHLNLDIIPDFANTVIAGSIVGIVVASLLYRWRTGGVG